MDAKLNHAVPNRAGVPKVTESNPRNALTNSIAGRAVTKPAKPLRERFAAVCVGIDANLLLDRHL